MADNKAPDNHNIDINQGNYNERIEGNYIQGRNNFLNNNFVLFGRSGNSQSSAKHSRLLQDLLKQVNSEVEIRINSSLHNRVYIVLDTEKNPEQIELPWSSEIKVSTQPKIKLNNTDIINIFDLEDIAGRLLILGRPGAGKTTMLLKLASELVKRAKNNSEYPVPVLFSLSAWKNDNQNIKDWLVDQLKDKYGLRKDIGKQWINSQKIIPLLDGLDELAAERQEKCIIKINEFLHPEKWTNPVVVCSRIQEYQNSTTLLHLNNSIELFLITPQQIYQYLQSTDNLQLWDSINHDADLGQLAQTPLLLNIIVLATEELSIQTWQQFKTSEERLKYLFDAYIRRMLKRPYKDKQPLQSNTERWLSWLSRRLINESATEFFIEKIQPDWLSNKFQKNIYNVIVWGVIGALIYTLIFGLLFGLANGLIKELIGGLIYGLAAGLIGGLIYGLIGELIENKIESIKVINHLINLRIAIKLMVRGLIGGLIGGLIVELILGLILWLRVDIRDRLIETLVRGVIFGLIPGLILGLIGREIQPVENLKFSLNKSLNGLIIGLILGLIVGLIFGLSFELRLLIIGLIFGLIVGLIFGFDGIELETKTIPNQGIKQSVINTIIISTITFLVVSLIFVIQQVAYSNVNLNQALIYSLVMGLCGGPVSYTHLTLQS